jgi:hypothetical protein
MGEELPQRPPSLELGTIDLFSAIVCCNFKSHVVAIYSLMLHAEKRSAFREVRGHVRTILGKINVIVTLGGEGV